MKEIAKVTEENIEAKKLAEKVIDKQSIIDGIFEQTKSLTKKQLSNKRKNSAEIVEMISGRKLDLSVLASKPQNYPSQFSQDYYIPVFKILNLTGDPAEWHKDKAVADFTNEVIYGRYDKDILPTIQLHNKYVGFCVRQHRNYQFLNGRGIEMLKTFIQQAVDTITEIGDGTYYDFRKKMFEKYKLPYQIELFKI